MEGKTVRETRGRKSEREYIRGRVLGCDPCVLVSFVPPEVAGSKRSHPNSDHKDPLRFLSRASHCYTLAKFCLITNVIRVCEKNLLVHLGLN